MAIVFIRRRSAALIASATKGLGAAVAPGGATAVSSVWVSVLFTAYQDAVDGGKTPRDPTGDTGLLEAGRHQLGRQCDHRD
ncbi:MAG: hypothetical protein OES24_04265, partial [Acidimicrobiia bacterium]|nr:hypothetical protein [Acidimicrobiia bacterium]